MNQREPNPAPHTQPRTPRRSRRIKLFIGICIFPSFVVATLITLHFFGLILWFSVPTGTMAPTILPGDNVMVEGFTFIAHKPRRGDIVVFKTDGIGSIPANQFWVKRVVGEPGDHVRIADGKLFINRVQTSVSNKLGEISYLLPPTVVGIQASYNDVTVPTGCFFVIGDNSTNSFDSRFFGFVPQENILGRIWFCFWPSANVGTVR